MNDRDLETMLGRYRPRGPAPELRHAVLSSGAGRRRVWPWAAAAAALLAVTVELNIATSRLRETMATSLTDRAAVAEPDPAPPAVLQSIDGPDFDRARRRAEWLTALERRDAPRPVEGGPQWP
jgi:hypothetical protein